MSRIQGVSALVRLRELYLSGNSLTVLDGVEVLPSLELLDVSDNSLTSLKPLKVRLILVLLRNPPLMLAVRVSTLQHVKTLVSLYASRNEVTSVSEVCVAILTLVSMRVGFGSGCFLLRGLFSLMRCLACPC